MRRATLEVRTRLGPQEDITAAAPRQGATKGVGPHRETPWGGGRGKSLHGPRWGDELHGRFLRTSGWSHGILPSSWRRIYGVHATTSMRRLTSGVLPFSRHNHEGSRTSRAAGDTSTARRPCGPREGTAGHTQRA